MSNSKYELRIDDAQRHALVTGLNAALASMNPESEMAESLQELAGMLADLDSGALNDFTA